MKFISLYSVMVTLIAIIAIIWAAGVTTDHKRLERAVIVCKTTAEGLDTFNSCLRELGEP